MTDKDFLSALEELKKYADEKCEEAMLDGDRKRFNLWDSRLGHLCSVTLFEHVAALSPTSDLAGDSKPITKSSGGPS